MTALRWGYSKDIQYVHGNRLYYFKIENDQSFYVEHVVKVRLWLRNCAEIYSGRDSSMSFLGFHFSVDCTSE